MKRELKDKPVNGYGSSQCCVSEGVPMKREPRDSTEHRAQGQQKQHRAQGK